MSVLAPVRRLVGRLTGGHRQPDLPSTAWFDEPDAADQISARSHGPTDAAILRSWVRDGYTIVVVRFIPAGADVAGRVTGPTNW